MLEDESDYLRLKDDAYEREYTEVTMSNTAPSSYKNYLGNSYKFISFDVYNSLNRETTFRESYQILDFLGDVGGLLELCKSMIGALVTWLAEAKLLNMFARTLFRVKRAQIAKNTFDTGQKVVGVKCFAYYYLYYTRIQCCCRPKSFRIQQKFIDKAADEMDHHTDIIRFIKQKKMASMTIWSLSTA